MIWHVLGMLASVVFVLVLAWQSSRWIARHGGGLSAGLSGWGAAASDSFRVVGHLPLGRNARLALVRLQEECYLLGVTEYQITLLKQLDAQEAAEWLREADSPAPPAFLDILRENLKKNTRK